MRSEPLLAFHPIVFACELHCALRCQESLGAGDGAPMSLEKPEVSALAQRQVRTRQEREIFLEMPEYRENIHQYLREAEVSCSTLSHVFHRAIYYILYLVRFSELSIETLLRVVDVLQLRSRPRAGYMKKQPDITSAMRCILVDWLVEVGEEYRLQSETLYLAVGYIDRFLSHMSVVRAKLQLVGTAAMFLAAKYEEIYPPDVAEFVYITDDTYSKKQVLRMEQLILKVLNDS